MKTNAADEIARHALSALAREHPRHIHLPKISKRLSHFDEIIPLIVAYIDRLHRQALPPYDPALPETDRLFDNLMTRFDVMLPHRTALKNLTLYARTTPHAAYLLLRALKESMRQTIQHAQSESLGAISELWLLTLYAFAFEVWLRDETPDKALTMARLYKGLKMHDRIRPDSGTRE